jgi:single-strand DNA-binding protein
MDMNTICFTGRLTKDAESKSFQSGKKFCKFTVANNTGFGEYESVQYFNCILLGDSRVANMSKYLVKGLRVGVNGLLEKNDWTNQSGQTVKDWQVKVEGIVYLSSPNKDAPEAEEPTDLAAAKAKLAAMRAEQNEEMSASKKEIPF